MKKTIVVTGGAGFIGSYVSRILFEKGHNVIVFDDFSNASGKNNLPKKIKIKSKHSDSHGGKATTNVF